MRLTLKIADPAGSNGATPSKSIERGQLTIGRAPTADWVLSDPDRLLSKLHCRVEQRNDRFVLTDTSTNGVFVNESASPLGTGNERALQDGDRLQLGGFTLVASIEARRDEDISSLIEAWPAPDAKEEWAEPGFAADSLPAHQEFFRPPPVAAKGIPEDWLAAEAEQTPAALPEEDWLPEPAPPQAEPAVEDLPPLPSAEEAMAGIAAHVEALHEGIQAVIASLSPPQAAQAAALLTRTYQSALLRRRGTA